MNFAIENGMPYLISNGRAYPVEINNGSVRIDTASGTISNSVGGYSLQEVMTKCGESCSSIVKKKRAKKEEE